MPSPEDSVFHVRTDVHVQWTTITDMAAHVRRLISPYSKFGPTIRIEKVGRPEERVVIVFGEERYLLALDWSTLAFVLQGSRSDLIERHGESRLRFFFNIFDDVEKLEGYGEAKRWTVQTLSVVPSKLGDVDTFRDTFLKNHDLVRSLSLSDAGVVLNGRLEAKDLDYDISFGPFVPSKDIDKHGMIAIRGNKDTFREELEQVEGLVVRIELANEEDRIDGRGIIKMLKESDELLARLARH